MDVGEFQEFSEPWHVVQPTGSQPASQPVAEVQEEHAETRMDEEAENEGAEEDSGLYEESAENVEAAEEDSGMYEEQAENVEAAEEDSGLYEESAENVEAAEEEHAAGHPEEQQDSGMYEESAENVEAAEEEHAAEHPEEQQERAETGMDEEQAENKQAMHEEQVPQHAEDVEEPPPEVAASQALQWSQGMCDASPDDCIDNTLQVMLDLSEDPLALPSTPLGHPPDLIQSMPREHLAIFARQDMSDKSLRVCRNLLEAPWMDHGGELVRFEERAREPTGTEFQQTVVRLGA
ncbi:unnamed protein product [Effrenium voratum]|uniref:Uncharacterized protein n=1 Tax=Effrenium voratum TaxID=2562239 RepID=A0AA36IXU6_9DINO|nr:unnamed protein product [Effrenium voratum]